MKSQNNSKLTLFLRKVKQFVIVAIMIVYFPIAMSFISAEKSKTECIKVDTRVNNNSSNVMVTSEGLAQIVKRNFPDLVGTPTKEMQLYEMERTIEKSAVVKRCEIYATMGGVLHIEITQREPIMHVFTANSSYYMDEESYKIAAQSDMRAQTVVVNGNVDTMLDGEELVKLCCFINDDTFWKAFIEQIFVTKQLEFILIPRVGDHIIEFGNAERMEEKFSLLKNLYTKGWQQKEWNIYKKVNLKYKGQVVCTKR